MTTELAKYLFKMKIKGTSLKGIFNFGKTVLTSGLIRWNISEQLIQVSEISPDKRILFNHTIDGKNLTEYKYNFKTDIHSVVFEIQELATPISTMKISDTMFIFITNKEENVINIHIIDREKNVKRKKIQTQIQQHIVISIPPDIYSRMPVNLEPEIFHTFMRIMSNGKTSNITIQIQAPDYISFCRDGKTDEIQSHGTLKKKKPVYSGTFLVSELKHILKLLQSTNVIGIYQPVDQTDLAPLCVKGTIKLIGDFEVFIHRSDIDVLVSDAKEE